MGNQNSILLNSDNTTLLSKLDEIASDFITTTHFNDLQNAFDEKYCNKLIVLTEKVLSNKFNLMDIANIHNRIENGIKTDNLQEKIGHINKNNLHNIQNTNTNKNKKILCKQIASFYMRIFMFYDAILKTINPVYIYKDYHSNLNIISFLNRHNIPLKHQEDAKLFSYSICMKRLHRFVIDFVDVVEDNKGPQYFKVGIKCDTKLNTNTNTNINTYNLSNEPGIPELKQLYYDEFNYKTNKYDKMSEKSENLYNEHVKQFYTVFTGNKDIPEDIHSFSDIPIVDYCKRKQHQRLQINVSKENELVESYANELITLIQETKEYEEKLMELLNIIFIKVNGKITISSDVTRIKLEEIIHNTKSLISNMYSNCENQFHKILSIFQVLVLKQYQKNEDSRREFLLNEKNRLY